MPITINGTTGIAGVDGSAATPALQGTDTNTGISFGSDVIIGSTGGVERWRTDSSGRVLVGTVTARSSFYNTNTYSPFVQFESANADNPGRFVSLVYGSTQGTGPILILGKQRSNSIGGYTLVSANDEAGQISFQATDGTEFVECANIAAHIDGTPGANKMPGKLIFSTATDASPSVMTERMRINSAGERLLNCTGISGDAPNNQGGRYFQTNGNEKVRGGSTSGTAADTVFQFYHGTITASPQGAITVNTTSTAFNTTSDYRLKENVTAVTDGITRLQQLKPSRFNFIADPDKIVDGFIAHEVQSVVPEAITGEKDAVDDDGNPIYQGIDQSKLVPLLTAALQEAVERIEQVEAEKVEQQIVLDDLLARVAALEAA